MGQSSSTQRDHRHSNPLTNNSRFSQTERARISRNEDMNDRQIPDEASDTGSPSGAGSHMQGGEAFPTSHSIAAPELWQQPTPPDVEAASWGQMRSIPEENGAHAERDQEEYRSATLARMAARRQSTMSRLGSRILPNSVIRGLLNSEEETPAEGRAHRHGIVSRTLPRSETIQSSNRFSPFGSLSSRGITRRRSIRGPYFLPRADAALIPDTSPNPAYRDTSAERASDSSRGSWRRSARLHRVRNSISNPISQMFGQPSSTMTSQDTTSSSQQLSRSASHDGSDRFLPLPQAMDTRMDFDGPLHELDSVEPAIRNTRSMSPIPAQPAQSMLGVRRFPGLLRARSSRILRREEQTPLSRVLQLAAAAIAAQLSGASGPVLPNIQSLGNDGLDGSLENFIQSLQHVTTAQTNATAPGDAQNNPGDGPTPPVNFLRVFRFANSDSPLRQTTDSDSPNGPRDRMDVDDPAEGAEGRTVTLVVVGVRSVPSNNGPGSEAASAGHGLDALLGLPFLPPNNASRNQDGGDTLPPRADGRPRFTSSRPVMGGTGALGSNQETLRHHGLPTTSRRLSDTGPHTALSSLPSILSESPPGPNPPPSTPAEPGLSAVSSGTSTPSRRPSSASAMPPHTLPQPLEGQSMQPTVEPMEEPIPLSAARQRRRSDSEYARHRDLGSGAARRNGMVEPDNSAPAGGRSWLIYVVGTNLSENHPAFATPSLFTDNPTYEDMILLSSLLGPAKPPVASQTDVNSAGGLFRLVEYGGSLVAESLDGAGAIQVSEGERCLICLSDYEAAEELRQLTKCKHLYHKDCIDQWLTTGRNSCPLCRGQGVNETSNTNPTQETTA